MPERPAPEVPRLPVIFKKTGVTNFLHCELGDQQKAYSTRKKLWKTSTDKTWRLVQDTIDEKPIVVYHDVMQRHRQIGLGAMDTTTRPELPIKSRPVGADLQ